MDFGGPLNTEESPRRWPSTAFDQC